MPYSPLKELKPELFLNEYEMDSDDAAVDSDSDFDLSSFSSDDEDEFNLDGLDIDDDVPDRVWFNYSIIPLDHAKSRLVHWVKTRIFSVSCHYQWAETSRYT